MFRLVALWVPIAAVLALALWNALFLTLDPWNYHWYQGGDNPPELDALPSQLLFTMLLVLAGRFETARLSGTDASSTSVRLTRVYWRLSAWLIGLGVVALWFMAISQPVLQ